MTIELFQYAFVLRALEAGVIVGVIAPLIGIFLVLRRYALIADTLAHVSFAGIALSLLLGINPVLGATVTALVSSLGIEKLRDTKRISGESALALFLSGSLALAIVLISMGHGLTANISNYLFGSIVTVTENDIRLILLLALAVTVMIAVFYKELVAVAFDEEYARVSGIPVAAVNALLMFASALTVALAIPIVGVLLISALIVIPVVTALQFKRSFLPTVIIAECISVVAVIVGVISSFYLDLSTGGTIVLFMLGIFIITLGVTRTPFRRPQSTVCEEPETVQ